MRDFTLAAYKEYLQAIKSSYENIFHFICHSHVFESDFI